MPALYGVRVSLNEASAKALAPWLDGSPGLASGPVVPIEVLEGAQVAPTVLERFIVERAGWLGRSESALVVGNDDGAWFVIDSAPVRVSGVLGRAERGDATRDLLLGALLVALRSLGVYAIHSAAVSFDDQALLLLGDSGAGKSTTATALVTAGCKYLGDDALLLRRNGGDVELLPLWSTFRLTEQSLAAFSSLRAHGQKVAEEEKWRLDVQLAFPNRFLSHWLGHKTVLFLRRSGAAHSVLRAVSKAEAVGLLIAQSSALGLACHPNPREHLDLLAQLAAVANVAQLELGTEWLSDPSGAGHRLLEQTRALWHARELRSEAS